VLRLFLENVHKFIFEISIRLVRSTTASNAHLRILYTAHKFHIRYFQLASKIKAQINSHQLKCLS